MRHGTNMRRWNIKASKSKKPVAPPPPTVYNNTTFKVEEIASFKLLGMTKSMWRGRNIALYQHPTEADKVVSHGTTFDKKMIVIAVDNKSDWKTALDYIAHGKVYISE